MANVSLGVTRGLGAGRICAIKTVSYGADDAEAEFLSRRFLEEAATASKLSHDNLVFVFDTGVINRELFLAMEFIEGRTLAAVLARGLEQGRPLPLGLTMFVGIEILTGLLYIHERGLVHRDVTPSNVMLSSTGAVKLLDFGLIRPSTQGQQTGYALKLGKPGYVAPEQFLGKAVDARSDLFSVGVLLWECLTGRRYIANGAARTTTTTFRPPHEVEPSVPEELGEILRLALADDPIDRYASAEEFLQDLNSHLAPGDYRRKLRTFMVERFGHELDRERKQRESLIEAVKEPQLAPDLGGVGPLVRPEGYIGTTLGERYEIKKVLAKGAMGLVFEGLHKEIGRRVAIKIPFFRGNADLQARFVREAHATNRINDERVVNITDAGMTPQGDAYVVMELIEGRSLEEVIASKKSLPPPEALDVAIQIARALEAAHEAGVVHRDLKPANIMLAETRDGTRVKILDFGVARILDDEAGESPFDGLTRPEVALGTPQYMAPEQIIAGSTVDGRADVYAAATVLYEMLTGVLPFEQRDAQELCEAKVHGLPVDVSQRRPLPLGLCQAVMGALEREPDARPRLASLWRSQLEALRPERRRETGTAPIVAGQRRRIRVGLPAVGIAALLVAGGVWGTRSGSRPVDTRGGPVLAPPTPAARSTEEVAAPPPTLEEVTVQAYKPPTEPETGIARRAPKARQGSAAHEPSAHPPGSDQQREAVQLLASAQHNFEIGNLLDCVFQAKRAARLGAGAPAFVVAGRAYLAMEEFGEAVKSFDAALVLDPGSSEAKRGLELARLGGRKDGEAGTRPVSD
ncbi:MAG: protein kinase [Myxococcales bacterium]|nr:protein kinase [Myxococcales bacterium]